MTCPYHVSRYLPAPTGASTGGAWVYGYPCGKQAQDPVSGACGDHLEPYDLATLFIRALQA